LLDRGSPLCYTAWQSVAKYWRSFSGIGQPGTFPLGSAIFSDAYVVLKKLSGL
jgi:hypothetical protein